MTFNWWTFLLQTVNFLVLAYALHRLLYEPLRRAVAQRREATERIRTEAEKARQDALSLQQRLQEQLAQAQRQQQELIHAAREEGMQERRNILDRAEQDAQQRQEESRQALQRERAEALKALHSEVVEQAIGLTRRLLSGAVDRTLHLQLVLRLLETVNHTPQSEEDRVRQHWQTQDPVLLETAQELDKTTQEKLRETVNALLGQPAPLTIQVKPALLGGARLRLAGHVWDGSLAGQLQETPS